MMKIKATQLQVNELTQLSDFEKKCEFWKNTFDCCFFEPLTIDNDKKIKLVDEITSSDDKVTLIRYEIERAITLDPSILLTSSRNNYFDQLERTANLQLTKEQIKQELTGVQDVWREQQKLGFLCYNGLNEISDIAKAFSSHIDYGYKDVKQIIPTLTHIRTKEFVKGYQTAILLNDILNYEVKKIVVSESENSNNSPLTVAIILKHYGIIDFLGNKHSISNDKAIQLLSNLFNNGGGALKSTSIGSSYRSANKLKTNKAQKTALKFLSENGITESKLDL